LDLDRWLLDKSVENMIEFYRVSLLDVADGETIVDSIPKGTRKRLVEYGILKKFGKKFELTDFGLKLLEKNSHAPQGEERSLQT
jgi:hypothetical protein